MAPVTVVGYVHVNTQHHIILYTHTGRKATRAYLGNEKNQDYLNTQAVMLPKHTKCETTYEHI